MNVRILTLLIGIFSTVVQGIEAEAFDVTFTANDGIRIESDKEILFVDAIYKHYTNWEGFSFDAMPENLIARIEQEKKTISILSTHVHRDHFHPEVIGELMDVYKNVSSYGPRQVVESIKEGFINEHRINKRLNCIGSAGCDSSYATIDGLEIKGVSLKHTHQSYDWIENIAFLIQNNNQVILHVGDAMLSTKNIALIKQQNQAIDLALLPYWTALDSKTFDAFMQLIKPKKVALIHLPGAQVEQVIKHISELNYKNIVVPKSDEKISF